MGDGGSDGAPYDAAYALLSWCEDQRLFIEGQIAASGGNPETMSLRSFMRVGYTVLVEAYRALGADLLNAVEKANQSLGLAPLEAAVATPTAADNDAALAELARATAGLKRRR